MSIKQAIEALPPLPRPYVPCDAENIHDYFTKEQMEAYALAALRSMPQGGPVESARAVPEALDGAYPREDVPLGHVRRIAEFVAAPHTEAVRMSEAEIERIGQTLGEQIPGVSDYTSWPGLGYARDENGEARVPIVPAVAFEFARAVEQATAARLGVKMGDV